MFAIGQNLWLQRDRYSDQPTGHKYPFIRTCEQMLGLCEAIGPNVGLLLDAWHWYTSLGVIEDINCLTAKQIVYVHVSDGVAGISVDKQMDRIRRFPGATGVIETEAFMVALKKLGYDGPVAPEPMMKELASKPPEECARLAGEAMSRIWNFQVG